MTPRWSKAVRHVDKNEAPRYYLVDFGGIPTVVSLLYQSVTGRRPLVHQSGSAELVDVAGLQEMLDETIEVLVVALSDLRLTAPPSDSGRVPNTRFCQ